MDTSDPATGRRNREVFVAAVAEGWRLADLGPAARSWSSATRPGRSRCRSSRGRGWSFDAAAGREEVLNRRIGRNELAVLRVLHDYVAAQRAYAAAGHDGKPAGRYARRFGSDPGLQNGLYWPARRGEPRSPLGVLVARGLGAGLPARRARGRRRSTATTSASSRARARPRRAAPPNTSSAAR